MILELLYYACNPVVASELFSDVTLHMRFLFRLYVNKYVKIVAIFELIERLQIQNMICATIIGVLQLV